MIARVITVVKSGQGIHSKFKNRRAHVEQVLLPSLRAIGIEAELFPAIMGSDVNMDGARQCALHRGKRIRIGEGCTGNLLSNYELWHLSVERNEPVLILEDDAILPPANAAVVKATLEVFDRLPPKRDILYLLSQSPFIKNTLKRYLPEDLLPEAHGMLRLKATNDLACTAAYVVNPASAKALMERIDRFPTRPTDGYVHTAFREGAIGVMLPFNHDRCFMLNENWAEWNHKHDPSA